MSRLAIAALNFNAPSTTFVRAHVRTICPGNTVLICSDDEGAGNFCIPTLSGVPAVLERSQRRQILATASRWWNNANLTVPAAEEERVYRFLREHDVRALLAEFLHFAGYFVKAAERASVPVYAHAHGFDASSLPRSLIWRLRYRHLFRRVAGVISPSRFLAEKLEVIGCPSVKLHVNPYGVDPTSFRTTTGQAMRAIAVGRLIEKKAPATTIRAFARAHRLFPSARLDMVGDGPLRMRCQALVEELGLSEAVQLHGVQPPEIVAQLMGEASIFLQHSVRAVDGETEGLPVAILEAMACALPVVSTRHSGIPEAVIDGSTGLLVDEHDEVAMGEALIRLFGHPEDGSAMGRRGQHRFNLLFTADKSAKGLRNIMNLCA